MDIGRGTNEDIDDINENFERIYDFIGIRPKEQFSGYQVHLEMLLGLEMSQ